MGATEEQTKEDAEGSSDSATRSVSSKSDAHDSKRSPLHTPMTNRQDSETETQVNGKEGKAGSTGAVQQRGDGDIQSTVEPPGHKKAANDSPQTPEESNEDESGESSSDSEKKKSSSKKKDKTKLRKGKWTVEEEEYTSRVIQHFSAGLLTLPDGATLRSYLADKLNCDPMRITKKFTGACCLGRRVYHLRERPRASPAELEIAKVERDHLEQRFRLRIEHEQSGLPLSRRQELLLAHPQAGMSALYPVQNLASGNTLSPWMHNLPGMGMVTNSSLALALSAKQGLLGSGTNPLNQSAAGWLLPGAADKQKAAATGQGEQSLQLLNNLVTSWAVAQAAASIPALAALSSNGGDIDSLPKTQSQLSSQLAQTLAPTATGMDVREKHRSQLLQAYEEHKKEEQRLLQASFERDSKESNNNDKKASASRAAKPVLPKSNAEISPAEQLQRSYEAHLQSLKEKESGSESSKPNAKSNKGMSVKDTKKKGKQKRPDEPMPDEEAGTVLLGFLNSLRQSYDEAVEENTKTQADENPHVIPEENSKAEKAAKEVKASLQQGEGENEREKRAMEDFPRALVEKKNKKRASSFEQTENLSSRPASVTDASSGRSQPAESSSSLEDSSNKSESSEKSEPSSSEDSDKEQEIHNRKRSKGPPRKRLKSLAEGAIKDYTRQMEEMDVD